MLSDLNLLLYAFRDLWKEWGDSHFQIFSQNCQFHHRRLESLEDFNVLLYIILSTTVYVLELKDAILFFKGFSFFLYTLPLFFCKYTLHDVMYLTSLTDSFDDRRSQCRFI